MKWLSTEIPVNSTILDLSQALATDQILPIPIANILVQRGMDSYEKAKHFFVPKKEHLHDPFLMKGMDIATQRILQAKLNNETILVYGDYDVDGTTSVALMSLFLQDWEIPFESYIPDRYTEGYGVSFKGIQHAKDIGAKLIISLDCGIKANDKVLFANKLGLDFIICDHHTPGAELPDAIAILDPLQSECSYPCKELSGCGVGLKLASGVTQTFVAAGLPLPAPDYDPVEKYCDLVTLSIACDIVPIVDENRVIAAMGLQKLRTNPSLGIKAIMNLSKIERKWDINDLVFFVGPRINSAGRLKNAKDAVEVLLGKSELLSDLANDLHDANDERRNLDTEITIEALKIIENDSTYAQKSTTVLCNPAWHKGVIGIVASRLIEKHYRPTVLFTATEDKLVGSARSVMGFDLYSALEQCSEHLVQFGGHKYAAGMTMMPENFPQFQADFDRIVAEKIQPEQKSPILSIDHELKFSEINEKFVRIVQKMEPFGPENLEPVFMTKNVKILDAATLKDTHIRLVLQHNNVSIGAVGFNMAQKFWDLQESVVHIAYHLNVNTWNGKNTIQLILKDIKAI